MKQKNIAAVLLILANLCFVFSIFEGELWLIIASFIALIYTTVLFCKTYVLD